MDTRIWTDNCSRCMRTCAPSATVLEGTGRVDAYSCGCGYEWTTARMVSAYEGFEFAKVEEPIR